jgi:hypothetical protein
MGGMDWYDDDQAYNRLTDGWVGLGWDGMGWNLRGVALLVSSVT